MMSCQRYTALLLCGLALSACVPEAPQTGSQPNYQAPVARLTQPANLSAVCFADSDLLAFRARMVQQELTVGVLTCKDPGGNRLFDKQYGDFLAKFTSELSENAVVLKGVVKAKGRDFDVVITEIANRTAQQPVGDPAFCSRHRRALEWSLAPSVTSLTQVPSPYDFGPEMNIFPCAGRS
jgi:hypothetical protein